MIPAEVTAFLKSSSAFFLSASVSLLTGTPPSVLKNANTGLPSLCASSNSARVYVSSGLSGISDPAMKPMIKITASESCTCSKQTSRGFDGSDTNSSMPQGTNSERRNASWADSRSGRRSLNVELTKIRISTYCGALSQTRCCGTAHAAFARAPNDVAGAGANQDLCQPKCVDRATFFL